MHAADDGVGREHQIVARRRREQGGIVDQTERAGMARERLEVPRDQAVFAGTRFARSLPDQAAQVIAPSVYDSVGPDKDHGQS